MIGLVSEVLPLLTPFVYFGPGEATQEMKPEKFYMGRDLGISFLEFSDVKRTWRARAPLTSEKYDALHQRILRHLPEVFGIGVIAHMRGQIYRSIYLGDCAIVDGGMLLESGCAFDEVQGTLESVTPLQPMDWIQSRLQPQQQVSRVVHPHR